MGQGKGGGAFSIGGWLVAQLLFDAGQSDMGNECWGLFGFEGAGEVVIK